MYESNVYNNADILNYWEKWIAHQTTFKTGSCYLKEKLIQPKNFK